MKLIVSLLAASLLAHTALAADQAIEVDRIVAVVNSDVITRTELRQRVEQQADAGAGCQARQEGLEAR